MSKALSKAREDAELKALRLIESILDSCDTTVRHMRMSEATIATEKTIGGEENFDGWLPIVMNRNRTYDYNLEELRRIREACRVISATNEIVKNVQFHFQNHIVGAGLIYDILPADFGDDPEDLAASKLTDNKQIKKLKSNWKKFRTKNKFDQRLYNMVTRPLRDGELGLHLIDDGTNIPVLRFIEANYMLPWSVTGAPADYNMGYFGVSTAPDDIEDIKGYGYRPYTTDEEQNAKVFPADEVVFIKRNTDFESLRGLPDYWPILANLRRLEKLHVNVGVLAQVQSAFALIRTHENQTQARTAGLVGKQSDGIPRYDPITRQAITARKVNSGMIIDAPVGTKYDFPAHTISSKNFIDIIHEDLARVAANFVLPVDWLLSIEPTDPLSPGSPTVANFKREQAIFYSHIEDLFWKVQKAMGINADSIRESYELNITGPHLAVGKALDQAQVQQILQQVGASSPQETAAVFGLSYPVQRAQTIRHRATKQPGEVMPGDAGNTDVVKGKQQKNHTPKINNAPGGKK